MRMSDRKITLQCAGCTISLVFEGTSSPLIKRYFIKMILRFYAPFISKKNTKRVDYTIHVTDHNLIAENNKYLKQIFVPVYQEISKKSCKTFYFISYIQFSLVLLHVFIRTLIGKNALLLHCSAIKTPRGALLFLGRDSAGKSTIVQLLKKKYQILSDDNAIIRKMNQKFYLYQTPMIEKNTVLKSRKRYLIRGFCFLVKSTNFQIHNITDKKTTIEDFLYPQTQLVKYITNKAYLLYKKRNIFLYQQLINHNFFYLLNFGIHRKKVVDLVNSIL